eukprot:Selendium_serpulae@DN10697_c0_g1_i1.p1
MRLVCWELYMRRVHLLKIAALSKMIIKPEFCFLLTLPPHHRRNPESPSIRIKQIRKGAVCWDNWSNFVKYYTDYWRSGPVQGQEIVSWTGFFKFGHMIKGIFIDWTFRPEELQIEGTANFGKSWQTIAEWTPVQKVENDKPGANAQELQFDQTPPTTTTAEKKKLESDEETCDNGTSENRESDTPPPVRLLRGRGARQARRMATEECVMTERSQS